MRIIFILTYPSYHSVPDVTEWLRWDNRDRRMPALLSAMGVDVELWGVGRTPLDVVSGPEFGDPYPIRLFAVDNPSAKSRDHVSRAMTDAARADTCDLFVLIGSNGGAGYHLFDRVLRPDRRRFAVIIGGDYWSRIVPHAAMLFPESAVQEAALTRPGWGLWRRAIPATRMQRLPKTIDTDRFVPTSGQPTRWDLIAISRLTAWKNFDAIGALSATHRVAVAGGGPRMAELKAKFPRVDWLGHVANADIPALLAQTALYFHAGRREYFPRAIVEAMACGKPAIGFGDRFGPDVIPPTCGVLVDEGSFVAQVTALLADPPVVAAMGTAARAHAVATHGLRSSEPACRKLIRVAGTDMRAAGVMDHPRP